MKQEQERAGEEVIEVAPGILRMQLPVDLPGLGHTNCYALEDERGLAVIDPGLPGDASWDALLKRMAQVGAPVARVHTVVVTHSHPDHFGLAGRLQHENGAELLTHRSFRTWWNFEEPDTIDLGEAGPPDRAAAEEAAAAERTDAPWERKTPWGPGSYRPPSTMAGVGHAEFRRLLGNPTPTIRVEDAEVVRLGRREWVAVHTPGHTPDHLCLLDPAAGVLLSGDHVLPTITPHISGIGPSEDPLTDFFASLDRMLTLDGVGLVLPAHGQPFTDLAGRVTDIRRHHEERLERLRAASAELGRPASVTELSQHLFNPKAWGAMAESETYAHLEHLRLSGQAVSRREQGELLYSVPS